MTEMNEGMCAAQVVMEKMESIMCVARCIHTGPVDCSQNSPISPNLIEFPISFKLYEVDWLDSLDGLRAPSLSLHFHAVSHSRIFRLTLVVPRDDSFVALTEVLVGKLAALSVTGPVKDSAVEKTLGVTVACLEVLLRVAVPRSSPSVCVCVCVSLVCVCVCVCFGALMGYVVSLSLFLWRVCLYVYVYVFITRWCATSEFARLC